MCGRERRKTRRVGLEVDTQPPSGARPRVRVISGRSRARRTEKVVAPRASRREKDRELRRERPGATLSPPFHGAAFERGALSLPPSLSLSLSLRLARPLEGSRGKLEGWRSKLIRAGERGPLTNESRRVEQV
jgi:hypothetical protein